MILYLICIGRVNMYRYVDPYNRTHYFDINQCSFKDPDILWIINNVHALLLYKCLVMCPYISSLVLSGCLLKLLYLCNYNLRLLQMSKANVFIVIYGVDHRLCKYILIRLRLFLWFKANIDHILVHLFYSDSSLYWLEVI